MQRGWVNAVEFQVQSKIQDFPGPSLSPRKQLCHFDAQKTLSIDISGNLFHFFATSITGISLALERAK